MEESKSSVDKLVKAVYVAGGAYFGIELLKMARDWFKESKSSPENQPKSKNRAEPIGTKNNYTFGGSRNDIPRGSIDQQANEDLDLTLGEDAPSEMQCLVRMLKEMKGTLKSLSSIKNLGRRGSANLEDDNIFKSPNPDYAPPTPNAGRLNSTKFRTSNMPNIPNFSLEDISSNNKRKHSVHDEELDFCKMCITGGPCAGKTTAIASISEKLRQLGYTVFIVPEAATMIFSGGGDLDLRNYSEYNQLKFQYLL